MQAVETHSERVQLHAHVSPKVRRELAEIARANERSISAEIRRALGEHVRREREQVALEAVRRGGDAA